MHNIPISIKETKFEGKTNINCPTEPKLPSHRATVVVVLSLHFCAISYAAKNIINYFYSLCPWKHSFTLQHPAQIFSLLNNFPHILLPCCIPSTVGPSSPCSPSRCTRLWRPLCLLKSAGSACPLPPLRLHACRRQEPRFL